MRHKTCLLFIAACLVAAIIPWLGTAPAGADAAGFPGWPSSFEGKALRELPLSPLELRFAENFPGRIGRFSDGRREIILRWVASETRKLHPASDCFRGSGYRIQALPIRVAASGAQWGRFRAARHNQEIIVEERIFDMAGRQWSDVSAWYWAAFRQQSSGPWWAVTVASRDVSINSHRV